MSVGEEWENRCLCKLKVRKERNLFTRGEVEKEVEITSLLFWSFPFEGN